MSEKKPDGLRNTLAMVLLAPPVMCALIGVVVCFSDVSHGVSLIGLGGLIGVVNFLVVKWMFKKISEQ